MAKMRRGNGEGSICKRPDGTWRAILTVGYDETGKRKRREVVGRTKAEVIEKIARLQSDAVSGTLVEPKRLRLSEFLEKWLASAKPTLALGTHENYSTAVKLDINRHLGGMQIAKITPLNVSEFYTALEREGRPPHAREMAGKVLRRAMGEALRLQLIPLNPCLAVKKPKAPKREMQVWTLDQAKQFLKAAQGHRLEALFVLAVTSGLREGELIALQWSAVDWETGAVYVQRSIDRKGNLKDVKSGRSRRRIDLPEIALTALREHHERQRASGYRGPQVFTAKEGGMLRKQHFLDLDFNPLVAVAGVPKIRFHDIRHTHISLLLAQGENPKAIQERAGHEKIETTLSVYSHVLPGAQRQVAERLNRMLAGDASSESAEPTEEVVS